MAAGSPMAADPNILGTLILLIGLELVLGIDNVLIISILTSRLPEAQQTVARVLGLALALVARIGLLFGVTWLLGLVMPLKEAAPWLGWLPAFLSDRPLKGLILAAGGLFLLYKAVHEIHQVVEHRDEVHQSGRAVHTAFGMAIAQIVALDLVFSLDSVITAVGLTNELWVIIVAVVLSFVLVLAFAGPVSRFILANPALKILALSFLLTIGVTIILEGFGHHIPKGYIYLPMGFALVVELLQMRYFANRARRKPLES